MPTAISWTDETWVPLTGCTRVSPACDHCYAFALHDRRHIYRLKALVRSGVALWLEARR